MDIKEVGCRV